MPESDGKKVLYYLVKAYDACTKYRCFQVGKWLEKKCGWKCYYDLMDSIVEIKHNGEFDYDRIRDGRREILEKTDVVMFHRATDEGQVNLVRKIKQEFKNSVISGDSDDVYFAEHLPDWNTGKRYFAPRDQWIREAMREYEFMTVTVPRLGEIYSEYTPNVHVLKNCIDFDEVDNTLSMMASEIGPSKFHFSRDAASPEIEPFIKAHVMDILKKNKVAETEDEYQNFVRRNIMINFPVPGQEYYRATEGAVVIGWGGSPTHVMDIDLASGGLRSVINSKNNTHLVMVGLSFMMHALNNNSSPFIVRVKRWPNIIDRDRFWSFNLVPVKDYYKLMKALHVDIGIAPVARVEFNKCKSALKVEEFCALGMYPIASKFDTYEGIIDEERKDPDRAWGALAYSQDSSWVRHLRDAIEDPAMREESIKHNQEFVRKHYSMEEYVTEWDKVLRQYV